MMSEKRKHMTPIEIERIFRDEAGRALATLIRLVGHFDLAQEALQDAFAVALERWPAPDPPPNPRAGLGHGRRTRIPYEVPEREAFEPRLRGVLAVIYLVFTEGYVATSGEDLMRPDLAREAIRLGRLLDALMPQRGEIKGLLALMLLHDARRTSRQTAGGDIVLLEEQDRALWDHAQIAEGLQLVEDALRMPARPEAYAVQAAIAALHARAPSYRDTDWPQIAGLYEVLLRISPSPVIELNHAAVVSMVDGPARALALIDALEARGGLNGYEFMPAGRAEPLRRVV